MPGGRSSSSSGRSYSSSSSRPSYSSSSSSYSSRPSYSSYSGYSRGYSTTPHTPMPSKYTPMPAAQSTPRPTTQTVPSYNSDGSRSKDIKVDNTPLKTSPPVSQVATQPGYLGTMASSAAGSFVGSSISHAMFGNSSQSSSSSSQPTVQTPSTPSPSSYSSYTSPQTIPLECSKTVYDLMNCVKNSEDSTNCREIADLLQKCMK